MRQTSGGSSPRVALVTGASSGLGKALCSLLHEKGYSLLVTARKDLPTEGVIDAVKADLNNPLERQKVVQMIQRHAPDLVINNAGFGLYGEAALLDTGEQTAMAEVNCVALLELTLQAVKALKAANKPGIVMNISSAAGFFVFPTLAVYSASKTFVTQISQILDAEMKSCGIRVLCACPGPIATDFQRRASKGHFLSSESGISAEKAAEYVYWQIEKKRGVYIFDWRCRMLVFIAKLLPKSWVQRRLRSSIQQRHASRDI